MEPNTVTSLFSSFNFLKSISPCHNEISIPIFVLLSLYLLTTSLKLTYFISSFVLVLSLLFVWTGSYTFKVKSFSVILLLLSVALNLRV